MCVLRAHDAGVGLRDFESMNQAFAADVRVDQGGHGLDPIQARQSEEVLWAVVQQECDGVARSDSKGEEEMGPLVGLGIDLVPGVLPVLKGNSNSIAVLGGASFEQSGRAPTSAGKEAQHIGSEAPKETGLGPGCLEFSR